MLTGSIIRIVGLPVFIGFNIGAILGPSQAMNLWFQKIDRMLEELKLEYNESVRMR